MPLLVLKSILSLPPKQLTLVGFVVLNTILIVTLRAESIVIATKNTSYIASTVVVFTELTKLIISVTFSYIYDGQQNPEKFLEVLTRAFLDDGLDVLKLCLPAILYAVQNNLQYVIETAPLFLVLYQSKIVTTAIFFTNMLAKRLSIKEWCCIIILAAGVSLVESSQHDVLPHAASNIVGMLSVIIACITSGFAGVYFEKVLKSSRSSVWVINIQLSMMSFSFSMILAMAQNPQEIIDHGLFKGFNIYVFLIVILQALNGLLVALVVKFSDNIHKGYGTSLAIVLGVCLDSVLFSAETNSVNGAAFSLGSSLVVFSSIVYYHISYSLPASSSNVVSQAVDENNKNENDGDA